MTGIEAKQDIFDDIKLLNNSKRRHNFNKLLSPIDFEKQFNQLAEQRLYVSGRSVGILDKILLKPGKLTPEEFEIMKPHAALGCNAMKEAEKLIEGSTHNFLQYAREISLSHHEKWDGSGYPQGLKGEEIPVSARLTALADVYDALISKRIYKEAMSHEEAYSMIMAGKGTHFDPDVVDTFVELADDFRKIAMQYTDDDV